MAHVGDGGATASIATLTDPTGIAVIRLAGELDISNIDAIAAQLEPVLASAGERVVFDLSTLDYMDSAGLAMLIRAAQKVPTIQVRNASTVIQQIIEATGLADVLHTES